jgi:hypothetical protein
LTDADLESNGVANSLHRRSILFAIKALDGAHKAEAGGNSSSLSLRQPSSTSSNAFKYDVFISYRRVGGADFAHLVKMHLKSAGLECFLDVENLGTGSFADALGIHLSISLTQHSLEIWIEEFFLAFIRSNARKQMRACAHRKTSFCYGRRAAWTDSWTTATRAKATLFDGSTLLR